MLSRAYARVEFLIQELTHGRYTVEAEVRSSSVNVVYVERLRIVFSKAALGFHEKPMELPLDPPLRNPVS